MDRDRVVELLRVAAGDGRLTSAELDERLEAALTARTYSELAVLTTDLPTAPGAAAPLVASALTAEPKDLVRIDCGSGSTKLLERQRHVAHAVLDPGFHDVELLVGVHVG